MSIYGSADDLEIALGNMGRSFLLTIIILYLLVSALFRSFRDSLLVYQTRSSERAGASRRDAVEKAVPIRLRPILMSTLTSLFGMLPSLLRLGEERQGAVIGGTLAGSYAVRQGEGS